MSEATSIVRLVVQTGSPSVPSAAPDITDLAAVGIPRGASFTWYNGDTLPAGQYFEFKTKITAAGSWDASWTRHGIGYYNRFLTDAEISSYGRTPAIYLKVRATNGATPGAEDEAYVSALHLDVADADIDYAGGVDLTANALDDTVLALMFSDSDKNTDELTEVTDYNFVTDNEKTGAGYAYTHLTADGVTGASKIDDVTAANVADWSAEGHTAQTKLAADVGAATIETTTGSTAKVDARLSSTEKTNLTNSLTGFTFGSARVDAEILTIGATDGNVDTLAATILTDLGLENVENLSGAAIMAAELDDTALGATTTAVLSAGVLAAVNASSEGTKIAKGQIATVKASSIQVDATTTALFNASGEMLDATVIGTGSGVTAANVSDACDSSGNSVNLDLTDIAVTGLSSDAIDDSAASTSFLLTATEDTQVGYMVAGSGFNSSGHFLGTLNDGSGNTASASNLVALYNARNSYLHIWTYVAANSIARDDSTITCTGGGVGIANAVGLAYIPFVVPEAKGTLRFRSYMDVGDAFGTLAMRILSEAEAAVTLFDSEAMAADGTYEVTQSLSTLTAGTRYYAQVVVHGTGAIDYLAYSPSLYIET